MRFLNVPKNYKNWWMYVKAIASQTWDMFLRYSVCMNTLITYAVELYLNYSW